MSLARLKSPARRIKIRPQDFFSTSPLVQCQGGLSSGVRGVICCPVGVLHGGKVDCPLNLHEAHIFRLVQWVKDEGLQLDPLHQQEDSVLQSGYVWEADGKDKTGGWLTCTSPSTEGICFLAMWYRPAVSSSWAATLMKLVVKQNALMFAHLYRSCELPGSSNHSVSHKCGLSGSCCRPSCRHRR